MDLLRPDRESEVLAKQSQQKSHHDQRAHEREFFVGQSVMARNLRPGPDWVPAVVVERLGPLTYLVETTDRLMWKRHVDLLRELSARSSRPEPGDQPEEFPDVSPASPEAATTSEQPQPEPEPEPAPAPPEPDATPTETPPPPEPSETTTPSSAPSRYPGRARHQPEWYGTWSA